MLLAQPSILSQYLNGNGWKPQAKASYGWEGSPMGDVVGRYQDLLKHDYQISSQEGANYRPWLKRYEQLGGLKRE